MKKLSFYIFLLSLCFNFLNKVSADTDLNSTYDEIKVDVKICIKKWPSSNVNEPNLALVKKSKLCPGPDGGRKYNIVKFKDLAKVHERTLKKRNICYNENNNRIKIRKSNCKKKEFYLKYKELNNEDIFYYETEKTQIAKVEPSQTQVVEKATKEKKLSDEKAAKEKKLADEKAAKEKKLADEKAAEIIEQIRREEEAKEKKLAEEKAAKEKKLAEEKAAKDKKLAEEKAAKDKKLAEEKAAKDKLNKKLSLIAETDLEKAQIFLKNLQDFVKKYPQEFDIIKLSEFFILTKPIVDGNLNVMLEEDLKNLKKFSESSDKFVKYIEKFKINHRKNKLQKIDETILSIETNISMIKKYMSSSSNSIHLERWLASVKSAEKVLNDPISYDQLLVEDQKLNKVIEHKKKLYKTQTDAGKTLETLKKYLPDYLGSEISELILNQVKNLDDKIKSEKIDDIVIANNSAKEFIEKEIEEPIRVAEEKKRLEYLKTPEGQAELKEIKEREKAEKERKKRAQKYKDNPIQIICDYGGSGTVTWGYDGKFINMNNGGLLKLGETQLNDFVINVELVKGKKDRFKISYLYFVYEVDFYNKSSTYSAMGVNGFGQCY